MTLEDAMALTEEQAWRLFAQIRWGSSKRQCCPKCGKKDQHYNIPSRRRWRCKACKSTFSVTTRTPFADRKISFKKLVLGIFTFVISQKGIAALALKRVIRCQYRTAFVLLHKLREAIMVTVSTELLEGRIEMDGAHFSGRPRKGNKAPPKAAAPTIPLKYQQPPPQRQKQPPNVFPFHPNRRIVMVLRVYGEKGKGAKRTIVEICKSENAADIEALVAKTVKRGSLIWTDELSAYGNLKKRGYKHAAVNHTKEFSTKNGVNENQAESFFSRMRRAVIGIYHRFTPMYMIDYANEMAWREDVRRMDTWVQLSSLLERVFDAGVSKDWCGYAQGHKRAEEILFQAPPAQASAAGAQSPPPPPIIP